MPVAVERDGDGGVSHVGRGCLAVDAGKCLLLDGAALLGAANDASIAIVADDIHNTL